MVVCPHCRSESTDPEFCSACNRELRPAPGAGAAGGLPAEVRLAGDTLDCSAWQGAWPADCWRWRPAEAGGRRYRLYALNRGWWRDLGPAVCTRSAVRLDVLAPLHLVPLDDGALVAAETLPDARAALPPPPPGAGADPGRLDELVADCRALAAALRPLHRAGFVWLNFDPGQLESGGDVLRIRNLDLRVFRAGECPEVLRLSGAYSPPEVCRFRPERIGPATDVFHVALFAYYWLAGLLPDGFPGRGLEAFDFEIPPLRVYRPRLPAGLALVLERGLDRDPALRPGSVDEFVGAVEDAVRRARWRLGDAPAPAAYDVGAATAAGRCKAARGSPNQDAFRVLPAGPDRVAVVADGVSHARFGNGERASRTACEFLAATLPPALRQADTLRAVEEVLRQACLGASRAVLDETLGLGPLPPDTDSSDLMSSTALIAVERGGVLTLACAGDSRAYLVTEDGAEQLTVDGDVRCTRLAAGAPPEEVRDLGADALALYTCLGVGEVGPDGAWRVCEERCLPQLSHWPLLPGDAIVLCSDGLVEEGVFLHPDELADLVREGRGLSAQALAERLLAAADALQREPSPAEPDGCGDNITCVVLLARAAGASGGERGEES